MIQSESYKVHLKHVEDVREVCPPLGGSFSVEREGQDLKIPDDPHAQEQPEVEENPVQFLLPLSSFHCVDRTRFSKTYLLTRLGYFQVVRAPDVFFTFVK